MRRTAMQGCGDSFSVGSLKHFDEQTLAVLAALPLAATHAGLPLEQNCTHYHDWGVLAAPRFLGRAMFRPSIARFHVEGAWGVSPHVIPYRSLHSISGTVSQFLQSHGPNFGVGGGPGSEAELLLAGVTLLHSANLPGVWLLWSRIEPELPTTDAGTPHPDASCEAIALAIVPAKQPARARLEITFDPSAQADEPLTFDRLAELLEALPRPGTVALGQGGRLTLREAVA